MELPPFNDVTDLSQEVMGEGRKAVCHMRREGSLGDAVYQPLLLEVVECRGEHLLGDLGDGAEEVAKPNFPALGSCFARLFHTQQRD